MSDGSALPAFLEPVEPERERMPYQPGNHGHQAEAQRLVCLHHLHEAADSLSALSDALRAIPDDDEVADALIARFSAEVARAGDHLGQFRFVRECIGQA